METILWEKRGAEDGCPESDVVWSLEVLNRREIKVS